LATARSLAGDGGELVLFARDPSGNQAALAVTASGVLFADAGLVGGCSAASPGGGVRGAVLIVLALFVGLGLRRREARASGDRVGRARRLVRAMSIVLLGGAAPACSCADAGGQTCELAEDCAAGCPTGQVPACLDGVCLCQAELVYGAIGPHSELAIGPDGTFTVSAYNRTHGDLMVAQ